MSELEILEPEAPKKVVDEKPELLAVDDTGGNAGLSTVGIEYYENGIIFPENYSFQRWLRDGEALSRLARGMQFHIGDWINFGESKYGEMYAQALSHTDFKYGTLRNAAWVCRSIPLERRNRNLTFAHHYEVAALRPNLQRDYLARASSEGWSVSHLRKVLRIHRNVKEKQDIKVDDIVKAADQKMSFDVWVDYYEGGGIELNDRELEIARDAWTASRDNL